MRLTWLLLFALAWCASGVHAAPGNAKVEFSAGGARALAWSPDARQIVAVRENDLVVLDAATLRVLVRRRPAHIAIRMSFPPAAVAYSPDGVTVATAGFDDGVWLWNARAWSPLGKLPDSAGATALAFARDGTQLVVGGPAVPLAIHDVASFVPVATLAPAPSGVISLAISPDGASLATGEVDAQLRIWSIARATVDETVPGYVGPVLSVAYSGDGRYLASAAAGREFRLLDLQDRQASLTLIEPQQQTAEERSVERVTNAFVGIAALVNPLMLTLGGDSRVVPPDVNCPVAFSPDGKYLALIHQTMEWTRYHAEVYEVASGTRISRHAMAMSALAFSPDGRRLAAAGYARVFVLDPLTGRQPGARTDAPPRGGEGPQ